MGIDNFRYILTCSGLPEVLYFSVVNKQVEVKSWPFPRGTLSVTKLRMTALRMSLHVLLDLFHYNDDVLIIMTLTF